MSILHVLGPELQGQGVVGTGTVHYHFIGIMPSNLQPNMHIDLFKETRPDAYNMHLCML